MRKYGKTVFVLLALSLVFLLFTGCGGGKGNGDDYVVEIGFFDCDHMVAAPIAQVMGFNEARGVKANVTMGNTVPQAMAAGQMDVGYIGTNGASFAVQQGSPLVAVAENHRGGSYYVIASHELEEPMDLVGKRFSIAEDAHDRNFLWGQMTQKTGLPIHTSNYQAYTMAQRDAYLALKIEELDAALVCDPWGSMAEYEDTGHILVTNDRLPDGSWGTCCLLFMRKGFIEEYPELAKRIVEAHIDAIEFIYTNPVKAAEIFADTFNIPEEVGLMTIYKKTVYEDRTLTWTLDLQTIENAFMNAKDLGMAGFQEYEPIENWVKPDILNEIGAEKFNDFIKREVDDIFPYGMSYEEWRKKAFEVHESKEY